MCPFTEIFQTISSLRLLRLLFGFRAIQLLCVCVCQPLDQGFTATDFLLFPPVFHPERNFHQQGHTASMTYRVQRSCGHGWEGKADHLPVPAFNTLTPMVHPAAVRCFHGPSSCYCPSNLGLSATCSRRGFCSTPPQSRDKLLC